MLGLGAIACWVLALLLHLRVLTPDLLMKRFELETSILSSLARCLG
jgi:hypothetical protein